MATRRARSISSTIAIETLVILAFGSGIDLLRLSRKREPYGGAGVGLGKCISSITTKSRDLPKSSRAVPKRGAVQLDDGPRQRRAAAAEHRICRKNYAIM